MRPVVCYCKQCQNKIGKFVNLWIQIDMKGSSPAFSPIIVSNDNLEILCDGKIADGQPGTLSENCNQIVFKSSSVTISGDTGKQANLTIKRVVHYNESSRVSTVNSAKTKGTSGTPRGTEVIDISLSKNELVSQASNEMTKVRNQVEQELADLRSQVSDLQDQVNTLTSKADKSASATDHANEIATLRAETADFRRLLSNALSSNNPERKFPSRELDILTSNMAKIGNRAAQVESLQVEFEIFKSRVERLEADRQTAETFMSPTSRKRTSSEAGLPETDRAEKLPVVSTRLSLSTHIPQLSTHRQNAPLEAAGPEGAHLERGQSPQPSRSEAPSKEREPGRGERN